ncbi:CAF17-like 4Fe-4S cluster assembly/insertion protein YgfZ [Brevirhabdus sp.]|uniref:CAF17-like 4Fe-4S cluster assembly/insertion protein YgfZ n=1 Tax=Brevirhabdus sp. TaxID=2004514 RepID=UPI00405909E6
MSNDRQVIAIEGADRVKFLHGLVTNDAPATPDRLSYAALLTPQGKYLADFFLKTEPDRLLLDVAAALAPDLIRRLTMYKLRADVSLVATGISVQRGLGEPPARALHDPRHPALGWRLYHEDAAPGLTDAGPIDWDALRVEHAIPRAGVELVANDSFPLEFGLDRLNGIDFRKGCYVGQEVTARMKHKTQLRKGLRRVAVSAQVPVATPVTAADGRAAGTLFTQAEGRGLAYLRFDRTEGEMRAADATVTLLT